LLSASVTSLSGGWLDKYKISIPWIIPIFSVAISIITSFTLFFKPREKGANLQQTADAMDLEYTACNLGIGDYEAEEDEDDALMLLAKRTEALRKDQQQRQQQLEQSSQAEQKALQPDGK
jgi:hypothetical protein